jgi:hypothetical protein
MSKSKKLHKHFFNLLREDLRRRSNAAITETYEKFPYQSLRAAAIAATPAPVLKSIMHTYAKDTYEAMNALNERADAKRAIRKAKQANERADAKRDKDREVIRLKFQRALEEINQAELLNEAGSEEALTLIAEVQATFK